MSTAGQVPVDTEVLKGIEDEITVFGDKIKSLKSSSGAVDKDVLAAAVNDLLAAKRKYAEYNNGIGIDGKPFEEPLTKAQQKAKAKAEKEAAAAAATAVASSAKTVQESDPDSKGAQKKSAKKAEKAAKKAAHKAPDGLVGTPAVTETTPAPAPGAAATITSQTKIEPSLTQQQTTAKKTNPTTAISTAPGKKEKSVSATSATAGGGVSSNIASGIKPGPLQIIINPNVTLLERPIIALSVACITDSIIDYELISDHRCRRTCMGTDTASGGIVIGDVAMARYIARRADIEHPGVSDSVFPSSNPTQLGLIETWVDYAISLQGYNDDQKIAAVTLSVEHTLAGTNQTYIVGSTLTLADICLFAILGFPTQARDLHDCLTNKINANAVATRRWINMMAAHPALQQATQFCVGIVNATEAIFDETNVLEPLVPGMNALEGAVAGRVVTRFPPEPSGYLHIGHAKACLLNDYYAKRYHGRLLVRFDDTNPSKEKEEYQESIVTDLAKLGVQPDLVTYTSDYFETIQGYAKYMLTNGLAFMDDTPQEQMQKERRACEESVHRNQSPADALKYFTLMCSGTEEGSKWCMRAKIDMKSDNGTLRDPVLYRQNLQPHHRSGTMYKAYPTYDLACPIVDSIEGVTYALRTTEYDDRTAQYYWFQKVLKLRRTRLHTFSRVNFKNTVLSKRKLTWFVDSGNVSGWDDPRFPTVRGVVRRGINIQALRNFMYSQGASKRVVLMDWMVFWSENKKEIDKLSKRYMAIGNTDNNVQLTVTNAPSESEYAFVETSYHPKDPTLGSRVLRICNEVLLETVDVDGIVVDEEIVLLRWGVVKITSVTTDKDGKMKLAGTYIPDGDFKAAKRKISWLANVNSNIPVVLTEFDNLISKDKLEETDDFKDYINPKTIGTTNVIGDAALKELKVNDVIQLERRGYYRCDSAYQSPTRPLVLFMIPDGKSKPMSGQAGQLAHR